MDFTVMTNFRVTTCADFDPEAVLDGPLIVEDDDDGAILISTNDPEAEAKLAAHASMVTVERVGEGIMITGWIAAADDPN